MNVLFGVVLEEGDYGSHLPWHQYFLSLLASLVCLFLPAERQKKRKDVDNVEFCIFVHFGCVGFFDISIHNVFRLYHHTFEPTSPSGPLGPPAACRQNNKAQTVK